MRGREGGWPPTRAGRRAHRGPEGPRPGPPAGFRQPPARRCARPASRAEERPYAHSPAHARERADRLARTAKAAGRRSPAVSGGAAPPRARLGWWATRTGPGWGAGPAGGGPPPTSYGGRAWPIPPAGPPLSELRRAIRRDRPGRSDLAGRRPARRDTPTPGRGTRVLPPAGSARWCPAAPSRPQPGTTNPSRKLSSLSKGSWCRRAAAGRAAGGAAQGPMRNTSPDRAPRTSHKLVARPAWRLATIHATKGGQWETAGGCKWSDAEHLARQSPKNVAQACGAASLAAGDDPRDQGGAVGDRRGLQMSLGKNVLFKGGLQPPPGGPGLKAVLERPCSPIPCDEGEDLLKGGRSRGISGRSADWRCIHAHFPVKNQVIP